MSDTLIPAAPISPRPARVGTETFWRKVEHFLRERTLIPVIGPGVITFGDDDRPLYPWLIAQLTGRLGLAETPPSLHALMCTYLRSTPDARVEDVCLEIADVLTTNDLAPGPLLRSVASISQCRLFFTLGFDPLFERALNLVRGSGRPVAKAWQFSLSATPSDLPTPAGTGTLLGYLFGKASANPGYLLWDADAIEFVWQLDRHLPTLNTLGQTLSENNLLILGTHFPDWLLRFLLRAIRQRPLSEGAGKNFLLADATPPSDPDAVVFYESLRKGIQALPGDPLEFAREFCRRAHALAPPLAPGVAPGTNLVIPPMEPVAPDGSIFISYSHAPADTAAAFRMVEKLRAVGCLVWLDEERLVCGDDFENHLQDAVKQRCGFFISVISKTTEGRVQAYFHKERNWAAERFQSMPQGWSFYHPVVIDDTPLRGQHEPTIFRTKDAERAPGGEISDALVAKIADLQRRLLGGSSGTPGGGPS